MRKKIVSFLNVLRRPRSRQNHQNFPAKHQARCTAHSRCILNHSASPRSSPQAGLPRLVLVVFDIVRKILILISSLSAIRAHLVDVSTKERESSRKLKNVVSIHEGRDWRRMMLS